MIVTNGIRANVPRKMTSATPLTEAEEIELERIKDRIEASICKFKRELDADLDKIRRSLQDMCRSMETTDASSGSRENLEKVNDIDSEPYVLSSSLESKDYLRVENSRKESVEFGAQNQGILILPPARENAQMKELVVSLPTPAYCNFASKWLLECDHMPKVKMKTEKGGLGDLITASTQEFGEADDAIVFLNCRVTRVVAAGSFFCHFAVDAGAGEILDHGKVNGIELEQYVVDLLDNKTFSQVKAIKETKRLPSARRNAPLRELTAIVSVIRNLKGFSVRFPKPMVKMKLELFSLWELLREADMLGVSRRKVVAHAWSLEQGLLVIELMTFNFSMLAIDHVNSAAKSNYMFSGLKWCCCWSRHCYAAWLVHIQV